MIVVIGQPALVVAGERSELAGVPARIAVAAACHGRSVQLVGTAGEDAVGDQVVLALTRAGVGHVTVLRKTGQVTPVRAAADPFEEEGQGDASPPTDPPMDSVDVDLALRYLPEAGVIVIAEPGPPGVLGIAAQAAAWFDARLIVLAPEGTVDLRGLPADAIVFEAPGDDPDGVFARTVGAFAAALDEGDDPATAFRASVETGGWTRAASD